MTATDDHFAALRVEYQGTPLNEADVSADPIEEVGRWLDAAIEAGVPMANAMSLATASSDGRPSVRVVLLKDFDARGFVFFTNYGSRKGRELEANPHAALCLWWEPLHRQVRIEGTVSRIDPAESDDYFATRPRESNLGAIASPQSQVIADRAELESAIARVDAPGPLVRPETWGGYRVYPEMIELWQGRQDRLHDRLRYQRHGDAWRIERLAP